MNEFLFFALGASVAAAVFVLAAVELLLSKKRRKSEKVIQDKVHELKANYAKALEEAAVAGTAKATETSGQLDILKNKLKTEHEKLEKEFQAKIDEALNSNKTALASAQAKAKKLEAEAKLKADEYVAKRQKEVEEDLMSLVLEVTKRVLPEGLSYDVQRDLVLRALNEVKADRARI